MKRCSRCTATYSETERETKCRCGGDIIEWKQNEVRISGYGFVKNE